MEKRDLTCIGCPLGCQITVTMENGEVTELIETLWNVNKEKRQ